MMQRMIMTQWGPTTRISQRSYAAQLSTTLNAAWIANILAIWHGATPLQHSQAAAWFTSLQGECTTLIKGTPFTLRQAYGVIAVLSANAPWPANWAMAQAAIRMGWADATTCKRQSTANRAKAQRVLSGEDPASVLGVLKTRAFYDNMLGPESTRGTIDIWVSRGITGTRTPVTPQNYLYLERHLVHAAKVLGVPARDVVALLWIVGRGSAN